MGQLVVKTSRATDKMLIDVMREADVTKSQAVTLALDMLADLQNGMTVQAFDKLISKTQYGSNEDK